MNILLIYPDYTYPRKSPPIGLASVAAYLKEHGHNVDIIDLNVSDRGEERLLDSISKNKYDAIGISFMTNQYGQSHVIATAVKGVFKDIPIVVGGPHASALPKETMEECTNYDVLVYGEGEVTANEVFNTLEKGDDLAHVSGISYRKDGHVVVMPPRGMIEDLNVLPFPAWDLLEIEKYNVHGAGGDADVPTFALLSSRGCPAKCTFCDSHTIFARKFRSRSAENIYSEILYLHEKFGMTQFDFVDDLITSDKERLLKLTNILKNSSIQFKWMANARINTLNREMLVAMKSSGCVRIDVGVESGDPKVRKRMRKGITNKQILEVHMICKEIGLYIGTFLMVGNYGETWQSLQMTVNLLKDYVQDAMISISCPYPGTEVYKEAKEMGYLRVKDWSQYSTAPTYVSNFKPLMVTDTMDEEEILKAFYYLHSHFALSKFKNRYGKYFFILPVFWREWVFNSSAFGGLSRKILMAVKLLTIRLVRAIMNKMSMPSSKEAE